MSHNILNKQKSQEVAPEVNLRKHASEGIHPSFKTQGRCHQKSKTRVSVGIRKRTYVHQNVKKKQKRRKPCNILIRHLRHHFPVHISSLRKRITCVCLILECTVQLGGGGTYRNRTSVYFFKKIGGPKSLFWISGHVCSGIQSQGGFLACVLHSLCAMGSSDSPLVWLLLTSW